MQRFSGLQLRTISLNTFFQFLARITGSISSLLVTLIIASHMGYSTIGSFVKVIEFVTVFYLLLDFGLNPVFLKLFINKIEQKLGNLVVLRLVIALLLFLVIVVSTFLLPQENNLGGGFSNIEKQAIIIYGLVLFTSALNVSWQAILQYKLASKLTVPASLLSSLTLILATLYAANSHNFYLLFVSFLISNAVYTTITYALLRRKFQLRLAMSGVYSFSQQLISVAWPLGIVLFINLLYAKVDIFLLSLLKQNVDVGIYGISYRFFDVAISIPAFLAASTYPVLLQHNNTKNYYVVFGRFLTFYAFFGVLVTILALLASPFIQLFKQEFSMSVLPLQLLLLSLPFFFLTSLLQWNFILKNKMKFLVPLYSLALIVNVGMNIIFIPRYSFYAAAIITGLSEALVFVVMLCYFIYISKREKTSK